MKTGHIIMIKAGLPIGLKTIAWLAVCALLWSTGCQTSQIRFAMPEHDFGRVPQMQNLSHTFVFTNAGRGPLRIYRVESG